MCVCARAQAFTRGHLQHVQYVRTYIRMCVHNIHAYIFMYVCTYVCVFMCVVCEQSFNECESLCVMYAIRVSVL